MHKTYFNWSSGKDSALALYQILKDPNYKVSRLLTTVNKDYQQVSMHGLREELLDQQVESLGFPIEKVFLPAEVSMTSYNKIMHERVNSLKKEGYTHCVFGDIFLEDLRHYREGQLERIGVKAVFPLWKKDTKDLLLQFINLGFKAITVCVNAKYLDETFCGRILDKEFLNDLPPTVDPCGENGEFHTYVFDGPFFERPVNFEIGEKVLHSYQPSKDDDDCFSNDKNWDASFWYCDLIPK